MSINDELNILIDDTDRYRKGLAATAAGRARWHKTLTLGAGFLALVSSGSIAAAIAKLADNQKGFQIVSLVLSLSSGIISLLLTHLEADRK